MANPYYNPGTNHTDYSQGHSMPQSPFQQSHPNTSAAQASAVAAAAAAQQHLPVYQHSPYAVHPLPPHSGYATAADHGALQYAPTMHHPNSGRWLNLNSMETDDGMLNKYRQDDPEPDYEMDHQSQDHPQQQQPQHIQQMQAPSASHESQTHASLQSLPPIAAVSNQPEQMSPATRPTGIRTGRPRGRPPGSKNKIPARRKSSPEQKLEEEEELIEESGPGIKTKYGRKVHAPQQFQPSQTTTSRKRRPVDETHFCHICNRAMTHSHDKMVFCDNCDTPYHQLCHQPPVSDATVNSNNKWFCSTCKPPPMVEGFNQRMVGQGLSLGAKRASLQQLSNDQLQELIIYASDMFPDLPLFPITGVDQFQVPRIHHTPRQQQRMPEINMTEHPQYDHGRMQEQELQQLPMTPMHEGPPQQSPLESPMYGQNTDLPHYELMIVDALEHINDPNGSPPKAIWDWMNSNYPCNPKFRASASQALQKALKKGRLLKTGSLYKINPEFNPATADNPKATRKPQVGRAHPLFNQMHSRNNSIATISSSPMQNTTHPTHQQPQQPQQQLPPPDLPPLNTAQGYLDHNAVFGGPLTDPTAGSHNPYDEPIQRPTSSHDLPPFPHHPHSM